MRFLTVFAFLVCPVVLAEEPVAAPQPPETPAKFDPAKHAWAKFSAGTSHQTRHVILAGKETKTDQAGDAELTEVTDKDCTVAIYQGEGEKRVKVGEMKYLLVAPECVLQDANTKDSLGAPRIVGKEKIKAAGKEFDCTVYEFSKPDEQAMQRIAVSGEGLRIRTESGINENGKMTKPVVELLVREKAALTSKDRKIECNVYESEDKELGEKAVIWRSPAVPGEIVRSETVSKDDKLGEIKEIFEITDWKIVERK
ncbi:MAG: hypothetical protein HY291_09030 [Planctomycetes bacterium]|nr:hypothetical protein [Planctomycetota bacterium]